MVREKSTDRLKPISTELKPISAKAPTQLKLISTEESTNRLKPISAKAPTQLKLISTEESTNRLKPISAEEKAAKIIEECGFVRNFLLEVDVNEEIRNLEEFARTHRPSTAKRTEPLTKFLPPEQAKKLEELRKERLRVRKEADRIIVCAKERISAEGIVLIRTKKGLFAEEKKPKKEEDKEGLAALFG